jgi:2-hydroxychromene-2-carboxylate isomerase
MDAEIDYYFALQSPFSYLGNGRLQDVAQRHGANITYKPAMLGRVFAATGGLPLAQRSPERRAYRLMELARWSGTLGIPLNLEPKYFPVDETLAARMVIGAQCENYDVGDLAGAIMRAVWELDANIADRCTLAQVAAGCGFDGDSLLEWANDPKVAELHDQYTEEAISRGVFGAPTYVLEDELFWGQDRLDFLDRALADLGEG